MVKQIEKNPSPMRTRIAMAMRRGFITPSEIAEDLGYSPASVQASIWWLKRKFPGRIVGKRGIGYRFKGLEELKEK